MALQQFVCCVTVLIIFFCKGCHSQQPACGSRTVNSSSSIVGVGFAAPGSWPWYADIRVDGGPPEIDVGVGGSLINDQWVLTAASIMSVNFSSRVVYLGRNSLSGPNPNEVNRTVVNIMCHPGFNSSTLENDICLLKLSAPVNFTDYIQPICLASENSTFNNETSSWAIGFASVFKLLEAIVQIVGNNVCKASYPGVSDSIICTRGPCLETAGAPLMTQSGSVWLQSGVFIDFGCTASPSVYTAVSQYQKWISDTVTGTPPGFVTFPSPDSSLQTTAPPTTPPTAAPTAPPTAPPTSPTCVDVFCSGENLIHFTHFTSLCVLVVLLHVFAATVGN